jgi:hypothetical protein
MLVDFSAPGCKLLAMISTKNENTTPRLEEEIDLLGSMIGLC